MEKLMYKRGLNRLVVIRNYSFEHVTVREWGVNTKPFIHVISKRELNNLERI